MLRALGFQAVQDRGLFFRQGLRGKLPDFLVGLAVRQVRLHRGLVVQPAVQHIIIAGLSFLVKLRVPQIAFRRLEGLPGEQDFPLCFKLPENAVL